MSEISKRQDNISLYPSFNQTVKQIENVIDNSLPN
jgi:hypothetical protein